MDDKTVFSVPWFHIVERAAPDSSPPHYILCTSDYVTVLAVTTDGSFLLVLQHRPAVRAMTLELPSGHVDPGESPEEAVRRELAEETGYRAGTVELLGVLAPDTGRLGNKLWCYYAGGVTRIDPPMPPEEGIELVECQPEELYRRVRDGEMNHALTLSVLFLAGAKGHLSMEKIRQAGS
jgi:ADP-ribose diphosphatase